MEAEFKESGVIGLFDVYLTLINKAWPPLFGGERQYWIFWYF